MIDHYENPRNVGSLDKNDSDVGTGLVGAPACGDVMKLQVYEQNITYLNTFLASIKGKYYGYTVRNFYVDNLCCNCIQSKMFGTIP